MNGHVLRRKFLRQFRDMDRYSPVMAWMVVVAYVAQIVAAIFVGHYLLSLTLSWSSGLLMALTVLFIGTRLRGINNIVHECSHSSFSARRGDNTRIGKVCSALLTGCFTTYKSDHLSHHQHIGDYEKDEEFAVIEKFRLHEPLSARMILRLAVAPLLGRHLSVYSGINLSPVDGPAYFGLKILVLLGIAVLAALAPLTAILFVIIPLFFMFPTLNFWTDCIDHAGLVGAEDELDASRNVPVSAPLRLLFFPRNDCYHLVHHLFPQVPARHLKEAHKKLSVDSEYLARHLGLPKTEKAHVLPAAVSRPTSKKGVDAGNYLD